MRKDELSRTYLLALIDDYCLAEPDTRLALQSITLVHPFGKILLISASGSVDVLVEAAV
jgi:hypothetical protein